MRFRARIERFRPEATGGLAVVDVPPEVMAALGGLKQQRVRGALNGTDFVSNTMPRGGGRLCMSVSKALMMSAGVTLGDEVGVDLEVGRSDAG